MSSQLTYRPLDNVGINGLNTQSNPASLDASWLTDASNIVLRESGRISFRKGLKQNVLATSAKIGSMIEHKYGSTTKVFAGVGTDVYTVDFTSPSTPWTSAFATGGTASDWQFINFNGNVIGVQEGHEPISYRSGDTTPWESLETKHTNNHTQGSAVFEPLGVTTFDPSCAMGYYGRIWAGGVSEDKGVMYYSDLLVDYEWRDDEAGFIDLSTVWGTDEIVAIAPFFGKLVIFGKRNIAIYNNPDDLTAIHLDEVIRGIGCSSRDTVQAVGDDLLFLSDTGLRSLGRTTQVDKVPLVDYSVNIKDTLIRHVARDSTSKAIYIENEGVYLLTFPLINVTYAFDMKHITPNNAPRVTTWTFDGDRKPSSLSYTDSKGLLIGQEGGSISTYEGYFDTEYVSSSSTTNYSYTGSFKTIWIDLGESVVSSLLKKLKAVIEGGSGTTVGVKWYKDFSVIPSKTYSFLLNPTASGYSYLFGGVVSLFGAAKYAPSYSLKEYNIPLTGSAKFLQLEMSAETNGSVASLQDMTLLFKQGKIR